MNALAIRTVGVSLTHEMWLALRHASKAITRYVLDGLALPPDLGPLANLILTFASGTAASTALHHFLRRNREHRDRIDLAIFCVAKMVKTSPQYQDLLVRPENLVHLLDEQIMPVLNAHLGECQAKTAMGRLKRKVFEDAEETRVDSSKRHRASVPDRIMAGGNAIVDNSVPQVAPSSLKPTPSSVVGSEVALAVSEADIQAQLLAEWRVEEDSIKDSIEGRPDEQYTPSGQHSTEVHAANSSQGTPTPRQDPFSSPEPLPDTNETSSPGQAPLAVPSTSTQRTFEPYRAMPPPLSWVRSGMLSYKSIREEIERRGLSPTPVLRRPPVQIPPTNRSSGYGLDYNDRGLYPTPSGSTQNSASSRPSSNSSRPKSHAAVRPSTNDGVRNVEDIGAHIQLALDGYSVESSNMPRTSTYAVVKGRQHPGNFPVRGEEVNRAQPSGDGLSQGASKNPSETPAQTLASVEAPKKKRGLYKRDVTQTPLITTTVQGPAASDKKVPQESSKDVFTAAPVQANGKAPGKKKKKLGPKKKLDGPSKDALLTTPAHEPSPSDDQPSHHTSTGLANLTPGPSSVEAPMKKVGRPQKHATQVSTLATPVQVSASFNNTFLHNDSVNPPTGTPASATSAEAPKKKRGRPRKNANRGSTLSTPVQDPNATVPAPVTAISTSKRRGRPPKTPATATALVQEQVATPAFDTPRNRKRSYLWVDESESDGLRT